MVDILFEDNHILVVVKPHNVPTQEDISKDKDMLTICKEYIKEKYNKEGNVYLGLVHRLDRPTGGIMVFAKTSKAAARLSAQIADHTMQKKYFAVVCGKPMHSKQNLVHYLLKDEKENKVTIVPSSLAGAKRAELDYEVVGTFEDKLSLVDVSLKTGRSHQIRVQMASLKTPIYSDVKYGATYGNKNLALFAYSLSFLHPTLKQPMHFTVYPKIDEIPFSYFAKQIEKICK